MSRIYLKLTGGLGNQLFQFAIAKEISEVTKETICLFYVDRIGDDDFLFHAREAFMIISKLCDATDFIESKKFSNFSKFDRLKLKFLYNFSLSGKRVHLMVQDNPFAGGIKNSILDFLVIQKKRRVIIEGYFQKPEEFESGFLSTISMLSTLIDKNCFEEEYMISSAGKRTIGETVIHVRRGDYMNETWIKNFGVLSDEYYVDICEELTNPTSTILITELKGDVYSITDRFKAITCLDTQDLNTLQSFSLMSKAKYVFVSNSTFSFWAAHVAMYRGGEAIFPTPWNKSGDRMQILFTTGKSRDAIFVD